MKTYRYKGYKISVSLIQAVYDEPVKIDGYDKTLQLEEFEFCKLIEIRVDLHGNIKRILLVASYHTPVDSFVAMHDDGLFFMLNDVLCIFDPVTLEITHKTTISPFGTMFEVHQFGKDYILYGENEIYRISENINEKWSFSGADIFVRRGSNLPAFEMKDDRICLYDWLDNHYEIDYDGNVITEILKDYL